MLNNRRLASSVLTGLFMTTCMLTPALAQEQNLKPLGTWALTKIDKTEEGGKSYCTLSRKYDDGVVLSLARNQTDEYSLAIDFQKDVFDRDKSMKVNLQPGPGQIRAYDMLPSSERAMVIRLGWDTGFFDALKSSQQMKVKIGDQAYAFAMPEVAKGQGQLQDCTNELQMAANARSGVAAAAPGTDVLAAAPTSTSNNFSASKAADENVKTSSAITSNNTTKEINAAQKDSADPAPVKVADAALVPPQKPKIDAAKIASVEPAAGNDSAADIKTMQKKAAADLDKSSAQVKLLQDRLAEIAKENAALKKTSGEVSPETQRQLNAMANEQTQLEERLLEAEQEKAKLSVQQLTLAERAADLEKKNLALQASLTETQKKMAAADQQASEKSEEQLKKLQSRLSEIVAENEKLRVQSSKVPEAQKQMDALAAEKSALQQKLAAAEKEKAALVPQNQLETAKEKARILEEQKAMLEVSLKETQAKADIAARDAAKAAAEAAKQEEAKKLSEIAAQKEALEAQLKEAGEKAAAQAAEAKKLADAAAQKAALEASLKEAQAKAAEAAAKAKVEEEAKIAAASEKAALEEKLAELKAAQAAQPVAKPGAMTPLPDNMDQLESLRAENKKLQEQLAAAAKGGVAAPEGMTPFPVSEEDLNRLKAEKAALEAKVATLEKTRIETTKPVNDAMQAQIQELTSRNKQLEESLRDAQTRIAETAINVEGRAMKTISELEVKLAAAQSDNVKVAKELEDLRRQQEDARLTMVADDPSLEGITSRYNEAEREVRRLGQQVEKEKQACEVQKAEIEKMLFDPALTEAKQIEKLRSLEAELKEARAGKTGPSEVEKTLQAENAQLKSQVASLQAQQAEVQKTAQASSGAEKTLQAENAQLKAQMASLQAQKAEVEKTAAARLGNNNQHIAAVQKQLNDARAQLEQKNKENIEYRAQVASMQTQLKAASSRAEIVAKPAARIAEAPPWPRTAQAAPKAVAKPVIESQELVVASALNDIQPSAGVYPAPSEPVAKVVPQPASYSQSDVSSLLQKAGVSASPRASSGGTYSWNQGAIKGLASIQNGAGQNFDASVNAYIAKQKAACGGDFASMPSPAQGGAKKMALYEVACVGSAQSTSSSLVFFEDKGQFVAIANQTEAANMDAAMDSRDKIASVIKGM